MAPERATPPDLHLLVFPVSEAEPRSQEPSGPGPRAWADGAGEPSVQVSDYAPRFYAVAAAAAAEGRTEDAATATLLGHACSFSLRLDRTPRYAPWLRTETERSAAPEDLDVQQVARLRLLWPEATDPALRARLADLSWELGRSGRRDVDGARAAVDAYLALAAGIAGGPEHWSRYLGHLERALQLAASLGATNNASLAKARAALDGYLAECAPGEDGYLTRELVVIATRLGGDVGRYFDVLAGVARRAEVAGAWDRARRYWDLAAHCAARVQDETRRREAARAVAEAFVHEAAAVAERPHLGRIMAAGLVQRAIEVLRRSGHERERVNELLRLLVAYQEGSMDSFVPTSGGQVDVGEFVERAEAAVAGVPLAEALFRLSTLAPLLDKARLRARAEDNATRYLGLALFPPVYHGDDGQVIARPGSVGSSDPAEREAALRAMMVDQGAMEMRFLAQVLVAPARRQVLLDHAVREHDFWDVLTHNPLVPYGREGLWAAGLYAGLMGDMPQAVHLLVPQMEHSVRTVLKAAGAQVSGLDDQGVQMMFGLPTLLFSPKLEELLGPDLTFTLQALLVEQAGPNIRHRMAHGLLTEAECYADASLYLWALALRLCCLPLATRYSAPAVEEHADENAPSSEPGPTPAERA